MQPIHVRWLIRLCDKLQNSGEMIKSALENASAMETIDNKEILDNDLLNHLSE